MTQEIRTKGSNLLGIITALETMRNAELRDAVVRDVPGDGGEELRHKSIIAAGWYPIAWQRDILKTIVDHTKDAAVIRELGRHSTRATVPMIQRVFMKLISPHTLIKQGGRLFSSYFENASVSVENVDKQVERLTWKDCHGFDKNCWRDQLGSTEELVALSGAKVLRTKIMSGGEDGDHAMVLDLAWR
jgi:hypothetical protein